MSAPGACSSPYAMSASASAAMLARGSRRRARLSRPGAQQGARRRRGGRLQRRQTGRAEAGQHARHGAAQQGQRRHRQALHVDRVIEVADGLRDQRHRHAAEDEPQAEAGQRPQRAGHQRLAEDEAEDLAAPGAQRAQRGDQRAALHHAEDHRVVDEKDAHHQRHQTQRFETDFEGRRHLRKAVVLFLGRAQAHARRQQGAQRVEVLVIRQQQVDARDAAREAQQLLRGGDVAQQQVFQRLTADAVRGLQQAGHAHGDAAVSAAQGQFIARRHAEAFGQGLAGQHQAGFADQTREGLQVDVARLREVVAKGRFGEGVHAQQLQGSLAEAVHAHLPADDRRQVAQAGLAPQLRVERAGQAGRAALDGVRGAPADAARAEREGLTGGAVGEVDGDDHRHAERHAHDQQRGLQEALRQGALYEAPNHSGAVSRSASGAAAACGAEGISLRGPGIRQVPAVAGLPWRRRAVCRRRSRRSAAGARWRGRRRGGPASARRAAASACRARPAR